MPTDEAIQIRGFKGLNIREHQSVISDNELAEAINVELGRAGELSKRTGFIQISNDADLGSSEVIILGHYITDAISQIIVKANNNVWYTTDGISYSLLGAYSDASFGVQYAGKFYIIRTGNVIVEWDGSATNAITGSPPGSFAIVYKERIWVLNSAAAGSLNSRIYFSKAGDVTAAGWVSSNFLDVAAGNGDMLIAMAIVQDLLVIFKGASTWALYVQGVATDWVLRSLNNEVGCVSKYAIQLIEGYLYISTSNGVFRTDGSAFEDVSEPIRPVLQDRIVNLTTINIDSFAYWEDKLICLLAPDSSTKVYYVYYVKTGGWTKWEFANGLQPGTFLEVLTNTPQRGLYAGDLGFSGRVLRYGDDVYQDAGASYPVSVKTKDFDFDTPAHMKRGKWIAIDVIGTADIVYQHQVDGEVTSGGAIPSELTRALVKFPGPGYFRSWQFIFTMTSTGSLLILGISLQVIGSRTVIKART